MVERQPYKLDVTGSSPVAPTILYPSVSCLLSGRRILVRHEWIGAENLTALSTEAVLMVSRRHECICLISGLASFILTSFLLSVAVPRPPQGLSAVKRSYFREHVSGIDLIFVGTSFIFRHISPAIIDSELRSHGYDIKSFNLGTPKMSAGELREILMEIGRAPRQQFVVISPPSGPLAAGNFKSRRAISFYTLNNAFHELVDWYRSGLTEERWDRFLINVYASTWYNQVNAGLLSDIFAQGVLGIGSQDSVLKHLGAARDGFQPLRKQDRKLHEVGERRAESIKRLLARLETAAPSELITGVGSKKYLDNDHGSWNRGKWLLKQAHQLRQRGIKVFILLSPPKRWVALSKALQTLNKRSKSKVPVLTYDVASSPELFDLRLRYDENHYHKAGAELFSHRLAQDLAKLMQKEDTG